MRHRPMGSFGRCRVAAIVAALAFTTMVNAQNVSQPNAGDRPPAPLLPAGKVIFDAAVARANQSTNGFGSPPSFPLPSCGFPHGLCGAVNRDGTLAVPPEYDWVDTFHEGRALVRSNGRYGYVDTSGRVIAEPQYPIADRFSRGFAQIDVGGRSGLIDLDGKTALEPKFGYVVPFTERVFFATERRTTSEGIAGTEQFIHGIFELFGAIADSRTIAAAGKWGLVDRSGAWLVPPSLDAILPYDTDSSALMLARVESGWGAIRPDGSWELEPKFQHLGSFVDGMASAKINDRWGFIDRSGRFKIEPKFESVHQFSRDARFTPARLKGRSGLINRSGEWVVQPQYENIFLKETTKGSWDIQNEKKHGLLDEDAKVVVPPSFDLAFGRCANGRIVGEIDKKPRILDEDGRPIEPQEGELSRPVTCDGPYILKIGDKFAYASADLTPMTSQRFDRAGPFYNSVAVAGLGDKFGLLRADATWAVEPIFDAISPGLPNGSVLARAGDRNGIIDASTGAWITTQRFERICHIRPDMAMAFEDGRRGILDAHGSWLIKPRDGRIGIRLQDGLVPAQSGERWGFADVEGTLAIEARYDAPTFFDRGINWARTGEAWCPIDRRGQPIEGLQCQPSDPLKRQFGVFACQL